MNKTPSFWFYSCVGKEHLKKYHLFFDNRFQLPVGTREQHRLWPSCYTGFSVQTHGQSRSVQTPPRKGYFCVSLLHPSSSLLFCPHHTGTTFLFPFLPPFALFILPGCNLPSVLFDHADPAVLFFSPAPSLCLLSLVIPGSVQLAGLAL